MHSNHSMYSLKTIVLVLAMSALTQLCHAQAFCPGVKFSVAPSFTDVGAMANIKFMADFQVAPTFRIGPGIGFGAVGFAEDDSRHAEKEMVEAYEGFIGCKWIPKSQSRVSFLLAGEAGYVWSRKWGASYRYRGWDGDLIDHLGPKATIAPGIDIAMGPGSLQVTAEWTWQQTSWIMPYQGSDHTSETFIGLGIAYQWGGRR